MQGKDGKEGRKPNQKEMGIYGVSIGSFLQIRLGMREWSAGRGWEEETGGRMGDGRKKANLTGNREAEEI